MAERLKALSRIRRGGAALAAVVGLSAAALVYAALDPPWKSGIAWPRPSLVAPGPPGGPPSDAIVLFDGKDLSQWEGGEKWIIQEGYAIGQGTAISTKRPFGDCQLHLEWASPSEVKGEGQKRGNSGVFLMGLYEVQILDSFGNETYFDGQAGAVYKQRPPLVNACRKPGEWQSYDIVFRAPRFDPQGHLQRPAYITVLHNGVLIQDHFEVVGSTNYRKPPRYSPQPAKLPMSLQYHGSAVRFRNIWIRELEDDREDLLTAFRAKMRGGESKP